MTLDSLALYDLFAAVEAWWAAPAIALALLFALIVTVLGGPAPRGSKTASFALTAVTLLSNLFALAVMATVVLGHVLHGEYGFLNRAVSVGGAFAVFAACSLAQRSYREPGFYSHVFVVLILLVCSGFAMLFSGMTALGRSVYLALF